MFKNQIKRLFHRFGFTLQRTDVPSNPEHQLHLILDYFDIDLVLDIGANKGQFASGLRRRGYRGNLVSFEPLSDAHQILTQRAINDPKWRVHSRCAIGDAEGEQVINISENSYSSSILPVLEAHTSASKKSAYVSKEAVSVQTLDAIAPEYLNGFNQTFLKIDVQGYEWFVLDGATQTLPKVRGVLCELSLIPLYDGQRLWSDLIRRFKNEGFTLWAIQKGFTDPRNGRTLQIDGIFIRTEGVQNSP